MFIGECEFRVSMVQCNIEDDYVEVQISDRASGLRIMEIHMTPAQYALSTIGSREMVCKTEYMNVANTIGCTAEHKDVLVDLKSGEYHLYGINADINREDFLYNMLQSTKEYEVDGWKYQHWQYNSRSHEKGKYPAHFVRYLPRKIA